jgi:hypothetical protein
MKIDFELLEKMVEAGASGSVLLAYLKEQHAKGEKQRESDRTRKSKENLGKPRKSSENSGNGRNSTEIDWDGVVRNYKKSGIWSRWAGADPGMPACKCPLEVLEKYGLLKPQEATA